MKLPTFAFALLLAGTAFAQKRGHFSWQNACFNNPTLPYCSGRDFGVKPNHGKESAARDVANNPAGAPGSRDKNSALITVGAINWRFADPFGDTLAAFNVAKLMESPAARRLIVELAAEQGAGDAEILKLFERLGAVNNIAISTHGSETVYMITGAVADAPPAAAEPGWKTLRVGASKMLLGPAAAVEQAAQRIAYEGPLSDSARAADQRHSEADGWVVGPAELGGTDAVSAGVKRLVVTALFDERLTTESTREFAGAPPATARQSMDAEELSQKLGLFAVTPLGQSLGTVLKVSRFLPVPGAAPGDRTKPVIYGLDGGPKEVKQ